ncbi:hypothetical protein RND81_09G159000 [Saponaria officinalis]|uniref:Uncharacterized protein n=1 Tax=Saponaria officinalis TaxID=3572 RepID=A0AAW1IN53_SAPOF
MSNNEFIEELTKNCDDIQGNVLADILSQNAETEYLKRHGLSNSCIDRETFKSKVPLVTYDDIKPDIERIYNGDFSPILCAQSISEFWVSSGTSSGQQKLIPTTDAEIQRRYHLSAAVLPYINERINELEAGEGKVLTMLMTRFEIVTPGGLLARPCFTSLFKNPIFCNDKPYPFNTKTSPIEAIHCSDHFQSIYTQLLCGLYQRHDVTRIQAIWASTLVSVIRLLDRHYSELCHDISTGTLSPKITNPSLRARILNTFMDHPETELADCIKRECSGRDWAGILKRIWPKLKFLETSVTGSMAPYIPILDHYSGGLPFLSLKYSSSECDFGFNLNPICDPYDISYTIMPNIAYFEFIPLNVDTLGPNVKTVDLANVVVGQEYELVVTTYNGLYRYRLGDVLCPTGFYNSTPQFKILRRTDVVLSIDVEKTTETELQGAIVKASEILKPFDTIIIDYTSNASIKNLPGHYVIYLELMSNISNNQENGVGPQVLEQCCLAMENALGLIYRVARGNDFIGPLEIRVVSHGTFEKSKDYAISKGVCINQFKMPRCVNLVSMLELLDSRVVSAHFSPSAPRSGPI